MKQYWQVVLWFLMSVVFAYFPFWFQRKLIFGAHIPLCILAAVSLRPHARKATNGLESWVVPFASGYGCPLSAAGCDPNLFAD